MSSNNTPMTEKKIQDYLHLYIGCRVEIDGKEYGRLVGGDYVPNYVNQIYHNIELDGEEDEDGYPVIIPYNDDFDSPSRVKPILRPLSDMTIEEWKNNWTYFSVAVANAVQSGFLGYSDKPKHVLVLENRLNTNTLTFNDGMILLRMGFDLFGLIDAKLALDKTKHP